MNMRSTCIIAAGLVIFVPSHARGQGGNDLLGAEIGDLDLSGDDLADVVEVVGPQIDFEIVDLESMTCTDDLPWLLGHVVIADVNTAEVHATIAASSVGDSLGQSVSAAADFNLDGAIDLLVGAPGKDVHGRGYVFYGPFSGGVTLTLDDADLVLSPAHSVDHAYGHMVAPLADATGDGIPEIRVRSARGALIEQRFITHIHDGATGQHLAAVRAAVVEEMWQPIEGDLDDDGDVDSADQFRLLAQIGRVADQHRIWADVDDAGSVTGEDFIDQYIAIGEHPGLPVSRTAVAVMAASGPMDCSCPPGVPPDCCVINQDGEVECCDEEPVNVLDCIKALPHRTAPRALADCEEDSCFDDWHEWLQDLMNAGTGENCTWPLYPEKIHYVDCEECGDSTPLGLYADGAIWICIDAFLDDEGNLSPEQCVELKKTLLEELLHAVQHCYNPTLPPENQEPCMQYACTELQAGLFIDCIEDEEPCLCAVDDLISSGQYHGGSRGTEGMGAMP